MELGGISVPGRSGRSDGAYLLKDLSAFETQLGGLEAFVMVSDDAGDYISDDVAAHIATTAADAYLESLLLGIATGTPQTAEPAVILKDIVARANSAIVNAAGGAGGSSMGATFVGALVSAERVWFGQVGEGRAYLMRGEDARELVVGNPDSETAADRADSAGDENAVHAAAGSSTVLGHDGVDVEVGSVDLNPGDVIVLCGQAASSVLSASDILGISCAECDAQLAAASLADTAVKAEPDRSVTVAIWSVDSSMFAPVPPPQVVHSPAPTPALYHGASRVSRAERIFLWSMSAVILIAFLALGGMALFSEPSTSANTSAGSAVGEGSVSQPAPQPAATATATQVATTVVEPGGTEQAEYPKTLTVPRNVSGGLWLRKKASTAGGSNLVIQLKPGAEVAAADIEEGTDSNGNPQKFYVFRVSKISSSRVLETGSYEWPPSETIKKVYALAASFEEPE